MIAELILVLCGIAISSVYMAVGIGGGILWTPLLILAYGLSPQEAITTSLLIQVIGMGSGSIAYFRAGLVKVRLSLLFFIVALPGVVIGSFISVNLSAQTVQMALGIMAMMLAIMFVSQPWAYHGNACERLYKTMPDSKRRQLLTTIHSNLMLDGKSITPAWRKPFDIISKLASCPNLLPD